MVVFDDLDFFIIKKIYNAFVDKKEITTWDLAKMYKWDIVPENLGRFLTNKNNLIALRLKRMAGGGFVVVEKNGDGKNVYTLVKDKVIMCKHRFPNGYHDAILVNCNGWCVFQT